MTTDRPGNGTSRGNNSDGTEYVDSCPNCGNDPLESSQNVSVELADGVTITAYLCGGCGVIYVPEPNETTRVERVKQRPLHSASDRSEESA